MTEEEKIIAEYDAEIIEFLRAQIAALKEQVAQLEFRNERLVADYAELQGLNENHAFNAKYFKAENEALKQQVEQGKRDAVPEAIRKDAERYLWLKSQKGLDLSSCGGSWIKGNIKFNASHRLCANGTAYAPYETLDEAIDAAIAAAPKQEN